MYADPEWTNLINMWNTSASYLRTGIIRRLQEPEHLEDLDDFLIFLDSLRMSKCFTISWWNILEKKI